MCTKTKVRSLKTFLPLSSQLKHPIVLSWTLKSMNYVKFWACICVRYIASHLGIYTTKIINPYMLAFLSLRGSTNNTVRGKIKNIPRTPEKHLLTYTDNCAQTQVCYPTHILQYASQNGIGSSPFQVKWKEFISRLNFKWCGTNISLDL